jgi:hypothetical protein
VDNHHHLFGLPGARGRHAVLAVAWLAWFGLGLQLYLILLARWHEQASLLGGLMTFLSYFTVLSNTLAAAVLTAAGSTRQGGVAGWLRRPWVIAGVATSIVLVGIAYSLLLRHLWDPQGWQWLANEILHDVMPLVFLGYWLVWVPKGHLRVGHLLRWAAYPALYFAWILTRGNTLGVYPYPFVDVLKLGYRQVWINAFGVLGGFLLMGGLVILTDRLIAKRNLNL